MSKLKTNLFVLALGVLSFVLPTNAFALAGFSADVCEVYDCILNNDIILVIATVAIIFLGIGAFFGKVNWGLIVIVVLGIVVIFGAGEIAVSIAGPGADLTCADGSCAL
jgi:type IV secretory pathway VirB2 component (pilin)